MNKEFQHETWYKELDSHIKCFYSASSQRKTILINRERPYLYLVVTRVNYLTTTLWIDHVNSITHNLGDNAFQNQKFGWLTEQKKYRRLYLKKIMNRVLSPLQ